MSKPLNLYMVMHRWSDGLENYIVASALIRAPDEKQAMKILLDYSPDMDTWLSDKTDIKCVGWATGKDFDKPEIVSFEL